MTQSIRRIAITGATGYIGSALARRALGVGWSVRALSRRRPTDSRVEYFPYDLSVPIVPGALDDVGVVVHLAADTAAGGSSSSDFELAAARSLLEAARHSGARVVFVSSQAARPDAPTGYGRSKWKIEQEVLAAGGYVVRPGLVYGGNERGLFGLLVRLVRLSPVQLDLRPAHLVQPIHLNDLAEGLLKLADGTMPTSCYQLGALEPVPFTEFLKSIAKGRLHRSTIFIPVPFTMVLTLLSLGRRLIGTSLDPSRLRSLRDLPRMECAADLSTLGLELRPLAAGMHRSGDDRRRRLLVEASILLRYILRARPSNALRRRYVRGVEQLQGGEPLPFPNWMMCWPGGFALIDGAELRRPESAGRLGWRLEAATLLAESSSIGARRFLLIANRYPVLTALLRILHALAGEGIVRLTRLPLGPWVRRQWANIEGRGR